MADNHFKFQILLLPIAFSRCTSVSLLLVHKKGQQRDDFTNIIDILRI